MLAYLLTHSLTHLLTHSLTHSLTYVLTYLLTYLLTYILLTYSLTYLLTYFLICLLTYFNICLLTCLAYLRPYLPTYLPTYIPAYFLACLLTYLLTCLRISPTKILTYYLSGCALTKLEHVQLIVTLKHRRRGDLSIVIKSPQATESTLLATRRLDNSLAGLYGWAFMTLHLWGENPAGKWQVFFADNPETKNQKKSTEQDIEDLERQIIEERRKERRDGISGTVEDPRDEIHHGRTREDYIRGEEIPAEDVSRRGEIPYDIYDRDSPIAGYIVKYSYVFWGTKD